MKSKNVGNVPSAPFLSVGVFAIISLFLGFYLYFAETPPQFILGWISNPDSFSLNLFLLVVVSLMVAVSLCLHGLVVLSGQNFKTQGLQDHKSSSRSLREVENKHRTGGSETQGSERKRERIRAKTQKSRETIFRFPTWAENITLGLVSIGSLVVSALAYTGLFYSTALVFLIFGLLSFLQFFLFTALGLKKVVSE